MSRFSNNYNFSYNCWIGRYYPFFLTNGNNNSNNQYYLYAIDSPSLSPSNLPYVSLRKMGEKTKAGSGFPGGSGNDVLNLLVKKEPQDFKYVVDRKSVNMVRDILRPFDVRVEKSGKNFPLIEFRGNVGVQKTLITTLRSMIRQKFYRISPGRYIDVMMTKTEYVVFKVKGSDAELYLEPVALYKNTDVERERPFKVNFDSLYCPKEKFSVGEDWKISQDLDTAIKKIELNSFGTKSVIS